MQTRKHVVLPQPWVIKDTVEVHGIAEAVKLLNNRQVVPFWHFYNCLFGKLPRTDAEIHDAYIASRPDTDAELYWGWRIWQRLRNQGFPMHHMEAHLRETETRYYYGGNY